MYVLAEWITHYDSRSAPAQMPKSHFAVLKRPRLQSLLSLSSHPDARPGQWFVLRTG